MSAIAATARDRWTVLAILVLAVAVRIPTLGQPLTERHEWRQTQTAFPAVLYAADGIDLLRPRVPVLGPPFELPFEFPLFQALASVPIMAGVGPDLALRSVGLVTFVLTAVLLWAVVRCVAGRPAAFATLVFFVFSPFSLVWSRTSMIEFLATAGSLGMLWGGLHWREHGGRPAWVAALGGAVIAMLVKPTTGIFYLLPLAAFAAASSGRGWRSIARASLHPGFMVLAVVPVVLALVWIRYSDALKAASPLTLPFTSEGLFLWNFGTLEQRLDTANWLAIARRLVGAVVGAGFAPLLLVAVVAAVRSAQPLFWLAMAAAVLLPVFTLFNLYRVHDYYLAAISPIVAAFLGLGAAWLWDRTRGRARLALAAGASIAVVVTAIPIHDYVLPIYRRVDDPMAVLPMAEELAAHSRPDDLVLVLGRQWSPSVHYYARRSGLALARELEGSPEAEARAGRDYRVMASTNPLTDPIWLADPWPWIGVVDTRTYVMGTAVEELRGASVAATDELGAAHNGPRLLGAPARLACQPGRNLDVRAGRRGTILRLAAETPREARISVSPDLAPIIAKRVISISPEAAAGRAWIRVTCAGAPSVLIESATDAAIPSTASAAPTRHPPPELVSSRNNDQRVPKTSTSPTAVGARPGSRAVTADPSGARSHVPPNAASSRSSSASP